MQEPVTSYFTKAFGEHMLHQQPEEIFSWNGPGPIFFCLGMHISESNLSIVASHDILLPDNAPVKVVSKINKRLVAIADVFTVNNPFCRTILSDLGGRVERRRARP